MELQKSDIEAVLAEFKDPETGRGVTQLEQVKSIEVDGETVSINLALTSHSAPIWEETRNHLESMLRDRVAGLSKVQIEISEHISNSCKCQE